MGFVRDLTGSTAADAASEAADVQAQAGRDAILAREQSAARAQDFFTPFSGVAERGVEASSFLADPQQQFDFLQSNPLFQLALDNANQQTQQSAASKGRLSAGDTLQQLSNNVLLSSQPLIDRQRQDILELLNLGGGVASSQANIEQGLSADVGNLTTDIGAALAAGDVGAANARTSGAQGVAQLFGDAATAFATGGLTPPPTTTINDSAAFIR